METMMRRPTIHDLLKEAMDGTISKVSVTEEAERQMANVGVKTASVQTKPIVTTPLDFVEKLAGALEHLADLQLKEAKVTGGPGHGPGSLAVTSSPLPPPPPGLGQSGKARHQPPLHPSSASSGAGKDPPTGLQTDVKDRTAFGKSVNTSDKFASLQEKNLAHVQNLTKAAEPTPKVATQSRFSPEVLDKMFEAYKQDVTKLAEDRINPAHISAGAAVPPAASASGEGVPSEPSDVTSQKRMIASNEAAINYTKREAKEDPKSDLRKVLSEPPLSSSTDHILQQHFDATGKAGVKIASAMPSLSMTAAAQALLVKMAEQQEKKGKEKKSNMPGSYDLSTPAGQSGFKAQTGGM